MIEQETIWNEIWPVVEALIESTVAEDDRAVKKRLTPGHFAAQVHDLFGLTAFDILLKTVLGRQQLGVTRAVETENGRLVHVEFAWPDPAATDRSYTAADIVTVTLKRYRKAWRISEINPASIDLPLTEPRAQGIVLTNQDETGSTPTEPWILPVALFAGALQLPLQEAALADPVERLLLPGLQQRGYGLPSLLNGRRLWRDFKKKGRPALQQPAAWAAAAEFIVNEQNMREVSKAAAGQHYQTTLVHVAPRVRQIKKALRIDGLDERYTIFNATRILLEQQDAQRQNDTPA